MSFIFSLATASPPYRFAQSAITEWMIEAIGLSNEQAVRLRRLAENSCVDFRYSAVSDLRWLSKGAPGMRQRNDFYKQEAPKLASQAATEAIKRWGGAAEDISHIIYVSCTGAVAPGVEFLLAQQLGLKPNVRRLGINFMGCFGAFAGLATARAFAQSEPEARILVICTELCSLHYQPSERMDQLVANSLFADGAAAAVVGSSLKKGEKPLFEMQKASSYAMPNSLDKMSWEASDTGFVMGLSPDVPRYLRSQIKEFTTDLLPQGVSLPECTWALHPGGKAIMKAIELECELSNGQAQASWDILRRHGNMSSATVLFILNEALETKKCLPNVLSVAFGPGLSMEGMFLRRYE